MLYQILQMNYFLFHFNRTNLSVSFQQNKPNLSVCCLILYMKCFVFRISTENAEN